MGRKSGEQVGLSYCHGLGGNQVFAYTKRQQVMSDDNCLDSASKDGPVKLVRCHGMGGNQAWNYNEVVSLLLSRGPVRKDFCDRGLRASPANTCNIKKMLISAGQEHSPHEHKPMFDHQKHRSFQSGPPGVRQFD